MKVIAILLASTISSVFAQSKSTASAIGDFIFDNPSEKSTAKPFIIAAGETMRIQWHIAPSNLQAGNVTVCYRKGQSWPDVGPWVAIATDIPDESYLDWAIPENFFSGYYMLQINTSTVRPQIRLRVSPRIQIYTANQFGPRYTSDSVYAAVIAVVTMVVPAVLSCLVL